MKTSRKSSLDNPKNTINSNLQGRGTLLLHKARLKLAPGKSHRAGKTRNQAQTKSQILLEWKKTGHYSCLISYLVKVFGKQFTKGMVPLLKEAGALPKSYQLPFMKSSSQH